MTSKYQVTLPKAIAGAFGIQPGDDIQWAVAGEIIHVIPPGKSVETTDVDSRLRLFDQATARMARRNFPKAASNKPHRRGWTREDLYSRGRSR